MPVCVRASDRGGRRACGGQPANSADSNSLGRFGQTTAGVNHSLPGAISVLATSTAIQRVPFRTAHHCHDRQICSSDTAPAPRPEFKVHVTFKGQGRDIASNTNLHDILATGIGPGEL